MLTSLSSDACAHGSMVRRTFCSMQRYDRHALAQTLRNGGAQAFTETDEP